MSEGVEARKLFFEVLPVMLVVTLFELITGLVLGEMTDLLGMIPGLIVLVPAVLDMRGAISCALGSRLSTGVHLGVIGWDLGFNNDLKQNVGAGIFLSLLTSGFLGVLAHLTSLILGLKSVGIVPLTLIAVIGGVSAGFIQIGITVTIALYSAKRGMDPDNVTIPSLATVGDLVGVLCLFAAAMVVQWVMLIGGV
ncbi:MAG: magnesium transporter [Candidatus Bathyarchaeia archaeon]